MFVGRRRKEPGRAPPPLQTEADHNPASPVWVGNQESKITFQGKEKTGAGTEVDQTPSLLQVNKVQMLLGGDDDQPERPADPGVDNQPPPLF